MKKIMFLFAILIIAYSCTMDNNKSSSNSKSKIKESNPNINRLDRYTHYDVTLFARPKVNAKQIGKLFKGQHVKIDSIESLFCSIHHDSSGDLLGYAPKFFLHIEPMVNGYIIFNRAIRYVHQKANIRSGRGTQYRIVDSFLIGSKAIVDSLKDGWYATFDANDNLLGYVHEKLIKKEPLPDFEIADFNWHTSFNYIIYNVRIRNNTNSYVKMLKVEFTTFDKLNNLINTDFTFVNGLQPHGIASAKGYATKFGNEHKANIRIVR